MWSVLYHYVVKLNRWSFEDWRSLHANCRGLVQRWPGKGSGDLKDSEVVTHIDFSLSDPLARGCSSLKVSNLAVT